MKNLVFLSIVALNLDCVFGMNDISKEIGSNPPIGILLESEINQVKSINSKKVFDKVVSRAKELGISPSTYGVEWKWGNSCPFHVLPSFKQSLLKLCAEILKIEEKDTQLQKKVREESLHDLLNQKTAQISQLEKQVVTLQEEKTKLIRVLDIQYEVLSSIYRELSKNLGSDNFEKREFIKIQDEISRLINMETEALS